MLLEICTMVVAFLLVLFVITQVMLPFLSGEPFFPAFRKSEIKDEILKAEHVLEKVAEATHLKKVVNEVQRRSAELRKKE